MKEILVTGMVLGCCLALPLFLTTGCRAGKQAAVQVRTPAPIPAVPDNHGCREQAAILASLQADGGKIISPGTERFALAWFPRDWEHRSGRRLVVSLHGSGGCAERMYRFWHRNTPLHEFAFLALQYAETDEQGRLHFDSSAQVYELFLKSLAEVEKRYSLSGVPVVLHGFSKGSAMLFELAAMDRGPSGARRVSAFIADSGAIFPDYRGALSPLLRELPPDGYGGARFWLYCGTADHEGRTCRDMQQMAYFVRRHGGEVDASYRYPGGGHGIFLTGGPRRRSDALDALFSYIRTLPAL